MRLTLAVLCLLLSVPVLATDFTCEGEHDQKPVSATYESHVLTFQSGGTARNVGLISETKNENSLRVYGYTKGIVFAGGGSQTVDLELNLLDLTAMMTIRTRTFYLKSETTYSLNCTVR